MAKRGAASELNHDNWEEEEETEEAGEFRKASETAMKVAIIPGFLIIFVLPPPALPRAAW